MRDGDNATRPGFTLDDVLAAREAIGGRLHRTPTFTSRLALRVGPAPAST